MGKKNLGLLLDAKDTALTVATHYVEIPQSEGVCGIGIRWYDGTSAATITLESTNEPADGPNGVAYNSTTAGDWAAEGNVITGPTAVAASSSSTNLGNIGMDRIRLKIVVSAAAKIRIRANWRSQ